MTHQTFKICVILDDNIENFYIKHFIDDFSSCFEKFKAKIFVRNDKLKSNQNLKIYWIDDENDEIIVSCEEDFRVYAEHGAHRKLYFSAKGETVDNKVSSVSTTTAPVSTSAVAGPSSGSPQTSGKKHHKDEETTEATTDYDDAKKKKRMMKHLKMKMRQEREKRSKNDDESKKARQQQQEDEMSRKILEKQQKYLERHQRRCEKMRRMFQSVMDPANLSSMESESFAANLSSVENQGTAPPQQKAAPSNASTPTNTTYPSPDQIKQLTSAITNVLQPCNLINKILGDVIGITSAAAAGFVPMATQASQSQASSQPPSHESNATPTPTQSQAESGPPSANVTTVLQNEDLMKKIAESCGEIANSQTAINNILKNPNNPADIGEQSEIIMQNIAESTNRLIDTETIIKEVLKNMSDIQASASSGTSASIETQVEQEQVPVSGAPPQEANESLNVSNELAEDSILVVTPPTRSRESSVDYSMNIDEGDREWTFIDDSPTKKSPEPSTSVNQGQKGFRITLTDEEDEQDDDDTDDDKIVIAAEVREPGPRINTVSPKQRTVLVEAGTSTPMKETLSVSTETPEIKTLSAGTITENKTVQNASAQINIANVNASRASQTPSPPQPQSMNSAGTQTGVTSIVIHHPDPKIHRSVQQMVDMGFSNEGTWLTQLLVNCDGDVTKALNFLTPNK